VRQRRHLRPAAVPPGTRRRPVAGDTKSVAPHGGGPAVLFPGRRGLRALHLSRIRALSAQRRAGPPSHVLFEGEVPSMTANKFVKATGSSSPPNGLAPRTTASS